LLSAQNVWEPCEKDVDTTTKERRDSGGGQQTVNRSENVSEQSSDDDDESIDGTDWWREVTTRLKRENRRPAKTHNAKWWRRVSS
jgi:hypothetical protein